MLDFETELNKLLSRETEPLPRYEFAQAVEMASLGKELLEDLQKKQTDVSLQVEEIYDLLKEKNTLVCNDSHVIAVLQGSLEAEKTRADSLAHTAIALCDLLEDFCAFARLSGSDELKHQAEILWTQSGHLLSGNNIVRIGTEVLRKQQDRTLSGCVLRRFEHSMKLKIFPKKVSPRFFAIFSGC
ncbi:hypothetical protein AGMMS50267_00330 [Spirochaetia bacterium]|nr:hypothetical protein AGMMS50267_00330 [Spirochaetia bacterium]